MSVYQRVGVAVLAFGIGLGGLAGEVSSADDKAKEDLTGTWRTSLRTAAGRSLKITLKLKQEGTRLTGSVTGPDGKATPIEEGKVEDGKLSFQITREVHDTKLVDKYQGEVKGGSIRGKVTFRGPDGKEQSRVWTAKRLK
jgi:hypothetical protein